MTAMSHANVGDSAQTAPQLANAVMKVALVKGAASMVSKTPVRMANARSAKRGSNVVLTNAKAR